MKTDFTMADKVVSLTVELYETRKKLKYARAIIRKLKADLAETNVPYRSVNEELIKLKGHQ